MARYNKYKSDVIYQIYTKSFQDTNDDGIGDLPGVIQHLDYLKDLGVDVLWLNPFYLSPQKDNGYDVTDYYQIDSRYGTMGNIEKLILEANKRGLKIMMDMVFNHTSTEHKWFKEAMNGNKKYQEFYFFREPVDGKVPTNWISKFGGSAWQYVEHLDKYYLHLFDKTQADLNWDNPEVREELYRILEFWMNLGIKGFRFDVVNLISKPDVFENDNSGDGRKYYTDGKKVHQYIKEMNARTYGRDVEIVTVGEMSSTTIDHCVKYAGEDEKELDMVFNFHHLKVDYVNNEKWKVKNFDFKELKSLLHTWQIEMSQSNAWNALFWNNHDQPRAASRFNRDPAKYDETCKMLATCIHMMRGTPYIYQGEEIGMGNPNFNDINQYRDVETLNYYDILNREYDLQTTMRIIKARSRDNSRTPMQWNSSKHAGFSRITPWIGVPDSYKVYNVENQMKEPTSIYNYYKKLISIRKNNRVVQEGDYHALLENHETVFAYKRKLDQEELIVFCNFYEQKASVEFDLSSYECILANVEQSEFLKTGNLQPYEAIVLIKK